MRRILAFVGVALFATTLLAQEGTEPAVRLDALARALKSAKAVRVRFAGVIKGDDPKTGEAKGELIVAVDNRLRLDMTVDIDGKKEAVLIICDGKQQQVTVAGERPRTEKIDPKLVDNVHVALRKCGVFFVWLLPFGESPDLDKVLPLSAARFGEIDRKGKTEVYRCQFKLTIMDQPFDVELWLDNKTNLPLKREIKSSKDGKALVLHETSDIELNPTLNATVFELKKAE